MASSEAALPRRKTRDGSRQTEETLLRGALITDPRAARLTVLEVGQQAMNQALGLMVDALH